MKLRWRFAQFFEFLWWRNYLKNRDPATYRIWKKAYWEHFLEKSGVSLEPGAAVLDAGCGPAGIFMVLPSTFVVDATDPLIARYAARLPVFAPADYKHVRFFDLPIERFSTGRQYDVIFCLNAINHVADLAGCLDNLALLTKPGGQLLLSVDVHRYVVLKRLFQGLPADVLHPQQNDLADYLSMLRQRNFLVERTVLIKPSAIFDYYLFVARRADGF